MTAKTSGSARDAAAGDKSVLVDFEDGIAWVTLNRPTKRNAINPAIVHEMVAALDALEVDERAQVVVITGAGDAFSAGQDLKEYFREMDARPAVDRVFQLGSERRVGGLGQKFQIAGGQHGADIAGARQLKRTIRTGRRGLR